MSVFGIAATILSIFYVGLSVGFMPADGARRIHGIGTTIISGVLAVFLWRSAQNITAPSSGIIVLFTLCLLVFIFCGGLGQLVGSMTRQLPAGSKARSLVGLLVIISPAALIGWGTHAYETTRVAAEKAEIAALSAFQDQTLTGSFGGYSITLPVVPSIHIVHACRQGTGECHTHFWRSTELNMASPDTLELSSIRLRTDDVILDDLAIWCAKRPQMLETVWCEGPIEYEFGLRTTDSRVSLNPNIYPLHKSPDAVNSVVCTEHWTSLSCHVKFDVVVGIEGYIFTSGLSPEEAGDEALKAIPIINRVWAAMSDQT